MNVRLWSLAVLGAGTGWLADIACVYVARGASHLWLLAASLTFACAAPIWWSLVRAAGGQFTTASIAWTVTATFLSLCAALILDGVHTVSGRTWTAFGLCIVAAILRATEAGK